METPILTQSIVYKPLANTIAMPYEVGTTHIFSYPSYPKILI